MHAYSGRSIASDLLRISCQRSGNLAGRLLLHHGAQQCSSGAALKCPCTSCSFLLSSAVQHWSIANEQRLDAERWALRCGPGPRPMPFATGVREFNNAPQQMTAVNTVISSAAVTGNSAFLYIILKPLYNIEASLNCWMSVQHYLIKTLRHLPCISYLPEWWIKAACPGWTWYLSLLYFQSPDRWTNSSRNPVKTMN